MSKPPERRRSHRTKGAKSNHINVNHDMDVQLEKAAHAISRHRRKKIDVSIIVPQLEAYCKNLEKCIAHENLPPRGHQLSLETRVRKLSALATKIKVNNDLRNDIKKCRNYLCAMIARACKRWRYPDSSSPLTTSELRTFLERFAFHLVFKSRSSRCVSACNGELCRALRPGKPSDRGLRERAAKLLSATQLLQDELQDESMRAALRQASLHELPIYSIDELTEDDINILVAARIERQTFARESETWLGLHDIGRRVEAIASKRFEIESESIWSDNPVETPAFSAREWCAFFVTQVFYHFHECWPSSQNQKVWEACNNLFEAAGGSLHRRGGGYLNLWRKTLKTVEPHQDSEYAINCRRINGLRISSDNSTVGG